MPRSTKVLLLVDGAAQKCRSVALDTERSRWSAAGKRRPRARRAPRRAARRRQTCQSDSRMGGEELGERHPALAARRRRRVARERRAGVRRRPAAARVAEPAVALAVERAAVHERIGVARREGRVVDAPRGNDDGVLASHRLGHPGPQGLRAAFAGADHVDGQPVRTPRASCAWPRRVAPASARSGASVVVVQRPPTQRRSRGPTAIKLASSQQLSWRPCSTTSSTTVCGEDGRSDLMAYSKPNAAFSNDGVPSAVVPRVAIERRTRAPSAPSTSQSLALRSSVKSTQSSLLTSSAKVVLPCCWVAVSTTPGSPGMGVRVVRPIASCSYSLIT